MNVTINLKRVMVVLFIAFWELIASGLSSLSMSQGWFVPVYRGIFIVLLSGSTIIVRIAQIIYYKRKLHSIASKKQMTIKKQNLRQNMLKEIEMHKTNHKAETETSSYIPQHHQSNDPTNTEKYPYKTNEQIHKNHQYKLDVHEHEVENRMHRNKRKLHAKYMVQKKRKEDNAS
eukprot:518040_1